MAAVDLSAEQIYSRECNMAQMLRSMRTVAVVLFFVATCFKSASGQNITGTILGTIKDQSGALVAGAHVLVTNSNTGLTRTVQTDSSGSYVAPSLPIGTYVLKAEKEGFRPVIKTESNSESMPGSPSMSGLKSGRFSRRSRWKVLRRS